MPWRARDARSHTKAARSKVAQRQWSHVANKALKGGASEKSAVRQANAVVGRRGTSSRRR